MKLLRLHRAGRLHLREPGIERNQIDPAEIAGERALGAATRDMCRHRRGDPGRSSDRDLSDGAVPARVA
jgi:hypothetical protein